MRRFGLWLLVVIGTAFSFPGSSAAGRFIVPGYPFYCPEIVTISEGAVLVASGTRLLVIDDGRVRIFNLNGYQLGTSIRTRGRAAIGVVDNRIVISDDGRVRIFNLNGGQVGTSIETIGGSRDSLD